MAWTIVLGPLHEGMTASSEKLLAWDGQLTKEKGQPAAVEVELDAEVAMLKLTETSVRTRRAVAAKGPASRVGGAERCTARGSARPSDA